MKQQTLLNKSRWLFVCLLSFMMTLGGASSAWADEVTVYVDADYSSDYVPFDGYDADAVQQDQMIYPSSVLTHLAGTTITQMTFYYKKNESLGTNVGDWIVSMGTTEATTLSALDTTTPLTQVFSGAILPNTDAQTITITFDTPYNYTGGNLLVEFNHPVASGYKKFTFWCTYITPAPAFSKGATRTYLPKTTFIYETTASGPALTVKDDNTKISSPYAYNFGLATAGTTKVFTLSNPGTAAVEGLSVAKTGDFGATLSATSIAAGGEATLTVTMPDATSNGTITLSSTTDGIDNFVFNVSGTVRDPNKVYESGFASLPDDWTTTGSWYYSAANGAYTTVWYLTSNARLITPKLTIAEGEKFFVEAKGYSTSNTSYQHLQMQYSADGTTWTNFDAEPTLGPSNWNTFEFTGAPAGKYYIAINASQADVRMFYGGELPNEPKMVVTQPASLGFGVIETTSTKTFTIANTGKATLEGINVTSSNAAFTISGAPTSLAANGSAEVTITMSAATVGVFSSQITVSATGMDNVQFTVTGVVMPDGAFVIDFNDNALPAGWGNNASYKWNFTDGKAYCTSAAELTSPKLQFAEGDFFIINATSYDDYDNNYIEITGSVDGSSWDAFTAKKFVSRSQIPYGSYVPLVVTDIPTTVKYIKIKGYYVRIDDITGLAYAPALSVTTGDPAVAVATPAAYDFGECSADATVTYHFANAGAGTINITNVAITGDGAASYSTNWTENVAAPFDLVITRTYDASKAPAAQEAVVTATTTDGDFVINVTGSDKAANAPQLVVSTTAIDFGKVAADAVETVTVTNNGTGSMTVHIYSSMNATFSVSPAVLTGIGAGESKTFDITFIYNEPYGVKNADVIVVPTYDGSAAINITVTGKAKDPATWNEDFAGNTLPLGWEAGNNWTIADGMAKGSYQYGSTSYLTTAPLTVSGTTDELTFDYQATGNYVSIKIQQSKDGGNFTDLHTISSLNNGDAGSYTITGLEAGSYQFRFANDNYNLDNFEGFALNLPDHMATITASSIPASTEYSTTMKEGQSFVATVTVKETRGVAEALTAKFYMGDEVIGTQSGNVAASGTETLEITCTPTVAAPSGAQMHIEVEYAGGTLSTTPVTRYVAAITYLTLDETSSDAVVAGTYDNVTLKRTFNAGWNTVCLPFAISDVEAFFGTGAKAYDFTSYTNGELGFTTVSSLTASYPYIVYVPSAITDDILLNDITIASVDATAFYRNQSGAYFRGTYAPIAAGGWTKTIETDVVYGVTSAGKIAKAGASATMKGFRAYFDLPAGSSARLAIYDDATGITTILDAKELNNDGKVYNLNGQRVENAHKGLYIVNGKKVVVK